MLIRTQRLALRAPTIGDLATFRDMISAPKVAAQLPHLPSPFSLDHARGWYQWQDAGRRTGDAFAFMICQDGALAGSIALRRTSGTDFDLGYWLGLPYWGAGLMSEAAAAVIEFACAERFAGRLVATTLQANPASLRVLRKLGFQVTGFGQQLALSTGRIERTVELALPI
jgi:RimJ/RimL family protein N-acetyltransferase